MLKKVSIPCLTNTASLHHDKEIFMSRTRVIKLLSSSFLPVSDNDYNFSHFYSSFSSDRDTVFL